MMYREIRAFVVQKIIEEQASKAEVLMDLREQGEEMNYRQIERILESEGIVFHDKMSRWIRCKPYYSVESIIEDTEALAAEYEMTLEEYLEKVLQHRR
ncbi:hypothetical protein [Kurthia huakuii]|uniref:hypothetical protein n=1 Tax=Kurthia huakuii TaxID=1421019 RepID=UPI000495D44C|nr:hypothetical protein [Kurthia huakuii]MBM7699140.1 hypothetical protein [Kurthia huakuii]